MGKAGKYHGIGINWCKIAILTKAMGREIRELKRIMPAKYRGDTVFEGINNTSTKDRSKKEWK